MSLPRQVLLLWHRLAPNFFFEIEIIDENLRWALCLLHLLQVEVLHLSFDQRSSPLNFMKKKVAEIFGTSVSDSCGSSSVGSSVFFFRATSSS